MSIVPQQVEFTEHITLLNTFIRSLGLVFTDGEAYRPSIFQTIYIKLGLSWTVNSMHACRCARDYNFFRKGQYTKVVDDYATLKPIGEYWEKIHPKNRWGVVGKNGKRKDLAHFERRI